VGKPEGDVPLGRPTYRWEDNNKMALREVELGDLDWIDMAQDRGKRVDLVNTVIKLRVPQNFWKFVSSIFKSSPSSLYWSPSMPLQCI
jgi:hypothetical protein